MEESSVKSDSNIYLFVVLVEHMCTMDAIEHTEAVDKVVLVSGDGDFDLLVDYLRLKKGKIVEVYGVALLTANSLIKAADVFSPIDETLLL